MVGLRGYVVEPRDFGENPHDFGRDLRGYVVELRGFGENPRDFGLRSRDFSFKSDNLTPDSCNKT
ncbi:MAG TPA: hypothetical protein VK111_07150 [Virgibacillus sp.]|nr:hypothetical protein [Virgibacillus sp.]